MRCYFGFLQRFVEVIDGKLCFISPIDEYLLNFFIYYSSVTTSRATFSLKRRLTKPYVHTTDRDFVSKINQNLSLISCKKVMPSPCCNPSLALTFRGVCAIICLSNEKEKRL